MNLILNCVGTLELPQVLTVELGRLKRQFSNPNITIEPVLTVNNCQYDLLAVMMCTGAHTTCYFVQQSVLYFYDGMQNEGIATPVAETLETSKSKIYYDHIVYLKRQVI